MIDRLRRARLSAMTLGAALGAIACFLLAPHCYDWFSVPAYGRGAVTVAGYHKGFDYFVVTLLTVGGAVGALLGGVAVSPFRGFAVDDRATAQPRNGATILTMFIVFATMCLAHDHPYSFMDMYHDGEHLEPASVMLDGGRPYRDTCVLHGFFTDGALDVLVLGDPPSLLRRRRVETVLNAAALALLVPIAAEVTATLAGMIGAVLAGLCAIGAGIVVVFPYYRILPLLIAVLLLLRFVRSGRFRLIVAALIVSWFGVVWSLDVGIYSVAATIAVLLVIAFLPLDSGGLPPPLGNDGKAAASGRTPKAFLFRCAIATAASALVPLAILVAWRADLRHFFVDSFVIIPRAADAIGSLPARPLPKLAEMLHPIAFFSSETARYYLPPVFYGFLLVLAIRAFMRGERPLAMRIAIFALFSLAIFRTAAGRCGWSHTRYAVPLLGIAMIAFVIEPAMRAARRSAWRTVALLVIAVPFFVYFDFAMNAQYVTKYVREWPLRQKHDQLVPYPMHRGRGIFTYRENAADLAALDALAQEVAPPGTTIYDLSGERALYYFLDRRPATRCADTGLLAAPPLTAEALHDFQQRPPRFVILHGIDGLDLFDGVSNAQRIPEIVSWIDAHFPVRKQVGRYTVALPR